MSELAPWHPGCQIEVLQGRAKILAGIRQFFDQRGFVEVQTPCLSRDVVVDRYIQPLAVTLPTSGGDQDFWLQTSPEFAMKRLLAAGARAIYQIGPAFRAGETGDQHNVEFTMLEWYRVGDDYGAGMDLLDEFARTLLACGPARRWSYRQTFRRLAEIDPFDGQWNAEQLNRILVQRVEPGLESFPAVIIYDWPVDQAALSRTRQDPEGFDVAERFELYCRGVELANGYHELLDAEELLDRNRQINQLRQQDGRPALPVDSRLVDAMRAGLPASSGVALGVDRLVMLALGQTRIQSVMTFDTDRA